MRTLDIIKSANGNLKRNKLRTILTISAVVVGSLTLSLTNGVGNGVKSYINKELSNVAAKDSMSVSKKAPDAGAVFGGKPQEYKPNATREFGSEYFELNKIDQIKELTGATKAYPVYQLAPEYITAGDKKYTLQMSTHTPGLELSLEAGSLPTEEETDTIVIPKNYAEAFFQTAQNAVGKKVTIVLKEPTGLQIEKQVTIKGVLADSLIFTGIVMGSGQLMEDFNIFLNQNIVATKDKIQTVIVNLPSGTSQAKIQEIKDRLDKNGFTGDTLENQIGSVNDIISTAQLALNLFGAIALLAATFGIVNTLLISVYERTKEIGLLKALGLSRKQVFTIFAVEAISIGFWGGVIGAGLGMGIGALINKYATDNLFGGTVIEGLKLLSFPLSNVVLIVAVIMFIAFLAGIIPALKASRLNPIDALRYE